MDELHYLGATEALERYRSRELSPVDVVRALIGRAERVEPVINAFAERMFEQALDAARVAEGRYGPKGDDPRPLEGVAVAAKEEQHLAGHWITDGTLAREPRRATRTSAILSRVLDAGGIIHARTTTSEFCLLPLSHAPRWGVTRNPWKRDASAGGSSGGSAASLAAGTSTLATGSDIGGSLRAPASLNGVVGYKPPYGRVPTPAPQGLDPYFHQGPLGRTVSDVALLQNVLVGPHPEDVRSLRPALRLPAALPGVRGRRIAYVLAPGDFRVDPEIQDSTRIAAESLRAEGAVVEEVALPWRRARIARAMRAHFGSAPSEVLALALDHPDLVAPSTLAAARANAATRDDCTMDEGRLIEAEIYGALAAVLDRYDALILPTLAASELAAGDDYVDAPLQVDGMPVDHFTDASLTPMFNICSACPVLAVPSGVAANGVPTGVQIVGRSYDDTTVFQVAAALERTLQAAFAGTARPQLGDTA